MCRYNASALTCSINRAWLRHTWPSAYGGRLDPVLRQQLDPARREIVVCPEMAEGQSAIAEACHSSGHSKGHRKGHRKSL